MSSSSPAINQNPSWVALTLVVAAVASQMLLFSFAETEPSGSTGRFWELMLGSAWSWWVYVNRRRLKQGYAFEFDALVFFAWPVVVPYYLVKSRQAQSRAVAISVWVLFVLPFAVGVVCYAFSSV
jgi:hypothetical protein